MDLVYPNKTLKFHDGYTSNVANCVDEDYNISVFQSYDSHVFLQRIMAVTFCELILNPKLCHFLRDITSASLVVEHCEQVEKDIPIILCKSKKILPSEFF